MATRTISTRLAISGDDKYKQAIAGCNSELSKLKSSLAATQSEYRNNANSLEALSAKSKALNDLYAAQLNKLKAIKAGLENARNAQKSHASAIDEYKAKIAATESQLEKLKESTGDTSEEQKQLTEELGKLKLGLSEAEAKEAAATKGINNYEKQLNNATIQLNDLDDEISQNNQYLEEAKNSADGCAKSIDQYGKEIKNAKDESQDFGKANTEAINTIAQALAAAGVAKGIQEIGEALKESVDAAREFESAITGVFKTVEGSDAQLQQISDDIKEMSLRIPAATTEIAGVAEAAGQLGIQTENITDFTEVMINLGVATNLTADEAATMLAQFSNITKMDPNDYERLGSTIVSLGNNFATTESKIVEMGQRIASAGTIAGFSEPQIMALATALSSMGIESEAGGSAMSKLISKLQFAVETGDDLEDFASVANMSAQEFKSAWGIDAVTALEAFISGLNDTERNGNSAIVVLNDLGIKEVRLRNAILSLASSDDILAKAVNTANTAWEENNALQAEADKRYSTTDSKMEILRNSVNAMKIAIGDVFLPVLNKLADAGSEATQWITKVIENRPWVVSAVTAITTAVGVLAVGITGYTVVTKIAAAATAAFTAVMNANPIFLVATAVIAAVAAISAIVATADDGAEAVENLTKATTEAQKTASEAKETFKESMESISATADMARNYVDRLKELESQGLATKEAQNEYKNTVDLLNDLIPELNLSIDDQTHKLTQNTREVYANIAAWEDQSKTDAYNEAYQAALNAQNSATAELEINKKKLIKAEEEEKAIREKLNPLLDEAETRLGLTGAELDIFTSSQLAANDATLIYGEYTGGLIEQMYQYRNELKTNEEEQTALTEAIDIGTESVAALAEETEITKEVYYDYAGIIYDTNEGLSEQDEKYKQIYESDLPAIQEELANLQTAYYEAYKEAYESINQQMGLFNDMSFEVDTSVQNMIASLDSQIKFMDDYAQNMQLAIEYGIDKGLLAKLSDGSIESAEILQAIADDGGKHIDELNEKFAKVEEGKETFAGEIAKVKTDFSDQMEEIENRMNEMRDELNQPQKAYKNASEEMQSYVDGVESKYSAVYSAYKSLAEAASYGWNNNLSLNSSIPQVSGGGGSAGTGGAGRYATGLAYVPYDDFPALLHKGERVLNAQEAIDYLNASIPSYVREGKLPQTDYTPLLSSILSTLQSAGGPTQLHNIFNISGGGASPNQTSREVERLMRRMLYEQ